MILVECIETFGWEAAIRGMRNPMNSWDKSDSYAETTIPSTFFDNAPRDEDGRFLVIGPNDLNLMRRLRNAGTDHRKFMRMITVYVDITAPLYWWKEFDTYKVGTVANSCSTMHKIHAKKFTIDDFSSEYLLSPADVEAVKIPVMGSDMPLLQLQRTIECLNACRDAYLETKDEVYWWQMIQLLPSSYNQRRTVMLNYEVLANIYKSRKGHKLDEWNEFCMEIKWKLPYSELITGESREARIAKEAETHV